MRPQDAKPPNVRTSDGRLGRTQPMPDNRVLIALDNGRSFVVDADRLERLADGTYLIVMTAADE